MTKATIVYPGHVDPKAWSVAHARGERPGQVPYGLHRLADHGFMLDYELAAPAGRDPRAWCGLANPRRWRRPGVLADQIQPAIAWDERLAVPLLSRHGSTGELLASGVIWVTDALVRGEGRVRTTALRAVLRRLDRVWTLSRAQVPVLVDWLGVDAGRTAFLPFGIDVDFFPRLPMPSRPMILSLGNDRDRDVKTLYGALGRVHRARPQVRLVVQSRSSAPAPPGVEVVSDIPAARLAETYGEATVIAIATQTNLHVSGMTAALEAMAVGRPVVMSSTPGVDDYVADGETGTLTRVGDVTAMSDALVDLIDQRELAESWGAAAAAKVRESHSESSMCVQLADILRSSVG